MTTSRALFGLLLLLAVTFAGGCHRDWDQATAFERALRCGITVRDVERLATELGASEFRRPQLAGTNRTIPDYYVSKNERLISLWFDENGRLVSYMSALTAFEHEGREESVRVVLCPSHRQRLVPAEAQFEREGTRSWRAEYEPYGGLTRRRNAFK